MLIPIKSFDLAKGRLSDAIGPDRRSELAREMAATVIRAAGPLPVWVVCGDHSVADFARSCGADVIWRTPQGLNRAVADGVDDLTARGFTRVVIAHADLPLAVDLSFLAPAEAVDTVFLVPDRRNDGSNVLSIPLGRGFGFHYGPGSAAAHRVEAERCGLPLEVISDERLGWDIDIPDDLAALDGADPDTAPTVTAETDPAPTNTGHSHPDLSPTEDHP